METEGIFHGNDGNEQQGCSLDPQSSSFLLQGHSSSSSSSKPSGAGGRVTLAHPGFSSMDEFPFPSSPSGQWDDFIPAKLQVEFAGNQGGFFHPAGAGGDAQDPHPAGKSLSGSPGRRSTPEIP